jgi:hypothetical protein
MATMKNRISLRVLLAAALTLPAAAWAQVHFTAVTKQTLMTGLNSGRPVVIATPLASGYLQTVSFVAPAGPMPQAKAARMIELTQKDLAARGIDKPTALQIAVTLLGGTLSMPNGDVQVPGLLPKPASRNSVRPSRLQVTYNGPYV